MTLPELLAPAGDYDILVTAVNAGADAVYISGERFGARAFAKNFTLEEIEKSVEYAHLNGAKINDVRRCCDHRKSACRTQEISLVL